MLELEPPWHVSQQLFGSLGISPGLFLRMILVSKSKENRIWGWKPIYPVVAILGCNYLIYIHIFSSLERDRFEFRNFFATKVSKSGPEQKILWSYVWKFVGNVKYTKKYETGGLRIPIYWIECNVSQYYSWSPPPCRFWHAARADPRSTLIGVRG